MANHMLTILSKPESWKKRSEENRTPYQGVVKHDWVPTGRIDFATRLNATPTTYGISTSIPGPVKVAGTDPL